MSDNPYTFGRMLFDHRIKRGWTEAALAAAAPEELLPETIGAIQLGTPATQGQYQAIIRGLTQMHLLQHADLVRFERAYERDAVRQPAEVSREDKLMALAPFVFSNMRMASHPFSNIHHNLIEFEDKYHDPKQVNYEALLRAKYNPDINRFLGEPPAPKNDTHKFESCKKPVTALFNILRQHSGSEIDAYKLLGYRHYREHEYTNTTQHWTNQLLYRPVSVHTEQTLILPNLPSHRHEEVKALCHESRVAFRAELLLRAYGDKGFDDDLLIRAGLREVRKKSLEELYAEGAERSIRLERGPQPRQSSSVYHG